MDVPTEPGRAKGGRLRTTLRVLRIILFPAIVVGVFVGVLPRIADLDQVWRTIRSMGPGEVGVLVVLTVLNIVTYWPMLVAAMPGLSLGQAAVVCQSSTAVAMTMPAGGALAVGVSYAMYISWGFTPGDVARSAMATFFANMSFKLVMPGVALLLLILEGDATGGLLASAVLGVAVLAVFLVVLTLLFREERLARRLGAFVGRVASYFRGLMGRPPVHRWDDAAARFREQMIVLLRDRGLLLAVTEVVSQLAVFSVLLAAVRFVGIPNSEVTLAETLAVFAFVRLASAVPIIPGNLGLAELGYIGGLVLAGAPDAPAVAAVLVFRFLTYFAQIPLGGVTYLIWRRRLGWRSPSARAEQDQPSGAAAQVEGDKDEEGGQRLVEQEDHREQEHPGVAAPHEHT